MRKVVCGNITGGRDGNERLNESSGRGTWRRTGATTYCCTAFLPYTGADAPRKRNAEKRKRNTGSSCILLLLLHSSHMCCDGDAPFEIDRSAGPIGVHRGLVSG
ncbi:hypothetical protein JTB14_009458 [Gonioctena quinquepunctata]|nr:hypothetical protein JTB14_009458 [Gonioctena quinquepunctata]